MLVAPLRPWIVQLLQDLNQPILSVLSKGIILRKKNLDYLNPNRIKNLL